MPFEEWFADLPSPRTRSGCEDAARKEPRVNIEKCVGSSNARNWKDAEKIAFVVVPPILLLIFGAAIGWIIIGFKPQSPSETK
jgi:hypothetical protein